MPEGIKLITEDITNHSNIINIHSFSLITRSSKRKHCTCLNFYETYEHKDTLTNNIKFSYLKSICLISCKPLYTTMKTILQYIYSILKNYKDKKITAPEQLRLICLKKDKVGVSNSNSNNNNLNGNLSKIASSNNTFKSYQVLKEILILEFYFSFLLNSLNCNKKIISSDHLINNIINNNIPLNIDEKSYNILSIGNNGGNKSFLKYHLNSQYGYPVVDYDLTFILDKFNVEDIIKIYLSLLMEYKLIIVFDDYSEINNIIFAFISILYPLKWNFPIISFITETLIETLEAPFAVILGLHSKYLGIVKLKF